MEYTRESDLAVAIHEYLTMVWKPKGLYFHVANERVGGTPWHTAYLKKQGMLAGVADIIFMWKKGCACVELKVMKNKQTKSQLEFEKWCKKSGVPYEVVRTPEELHKLLKKWRLL